MALGTKSAGTIPVNKPAGEPTEKQYENRVEKGTGQYLFVLQLFRIDFALFSITLLKKTHIATKFASFEIFPA